MSEKDIIMQTELETPVESTAVEVVEEITEPVQEEKVVEPLTDWSKIDEMERQIELSKVTIRKKSRIGMRFRRIFGNTVGQVILTILSILWVVPLFYLIVQSFRKEPGAWSPTFFPQEWTTTSVFSLKQNSPDGMATPCSSQCAVVLSPHFLCLQWHTHSAVSSSRQESPS